MQKGKASNHRDARGLHIKTTQGSFAQAQDAKTNQNEEALKDSKDDTKTMWSFSSKRQQFNNTPAKQTGETGIVHSLETLTKQFLGDSFAEFQQNLFQGRERISYVKVGAIGCLGSLLAAILWQNQSVGANQLSKTKLSPASPALETNANLAMVFRRLAVYRHVSDNLYVKALKYADRIVDRRLQIQKQKCCVAEDMTIFQTYCSAIRAAVDNMKLLASTQPDPIKAQREVNAIDIILAQLKEELLEEGYAYTALTMRCGPDGQFIA